VEGVKKYPVCVLIFFEAKNKVVLKRKKALFVRRFVEEP
jgi:hypothetical protein